MTKLYYLYLLMSIFFQKIDGRQFRFDYDFFSEQTGWFKVHRIPATWNEARHRCQLEGSVLASPLNDYIKTAMLTLISTNGLSSSSVFTGLNSVLSKGDYASIEGVPIARINLRWAPGEPDNLDNNESCLVLYINGTVGDVNCGLQYPYICYKKIITNNIIMNNCGIFDNEYQLNPLTGSCYKFHNQPQNWSQAYMTCMAEGGYLLIINSNEEAKIIQDIYERNKSMPIIGDYQKDVVLVGFHDWGIRNNWITIHGETLKEAGYASWATGQPNHISPGQSCGGAFRATALLADLFCEHLYPFICEKSPNSLLKDDN